MAVLAMGPGIYLHAPRPTSTTDPLDLRHRQCRLRPPDPLTPIVTSGGDGRNFGEKKCSPLLMKVTTFVLAAWVKAEGPTYDVWQ